eukprot:9958669-Lingulodinium_polyedra.AAC.1
MHQPSTATTAHKSHARALHTNASFGVRMERARARLWNRRGDRPSSRPHHCAPFLKRRTMMRSNQSSAAATAR